MAGRWWRRATGRGYFVAPVALWALVGASVGVIGGVGLGGAVAQEAAPRVTTMTLDEARARIPERGQPDFWFGDLERAMAVIETVPEDRRSTLALSSAGRALPLVVYGEREDQSGPANFNSAIGAREPAAYIDKDQRTRPVLMLLGPVHGHEVEGLTGLINLIAVMETGRDLRGRDQARLRALGQRCRLLIIPIGNPDGIARFEPRRLDGMALADLEFWGQGTWADDRLAGWPGIKRVHPMVGDAVGFLGCYFNDDGVNPMHDEFFAPMSAEVAAFLELARVEGPDLAVSLHSHAAAPALLRPAYVPMAVQSDVRDLAQRYYARLDERDLPHAQPFTVRAEDSAMPASFNLTSALYHVSGAAPFTFESPHDLDMPRACRLSLEDILDVQLLLYEAMMDWALERKAPPIADSGAEG